jgi:cystathionine beta-synthase
MAAAARRPPLALSRCYPRGVLDLIGRTPLLHITHLDTGPLEPRLELENQDPDGSIEDRIGRSMIEAAAAVCGVASGGITGAHAT